MRLFPKLLMVMLSGSLCTGAFLVIQQGSFRRGGVAKDPIDTSNGKELEETVARLEAALINLQGRLARLEASGRVAAPLARPGESTEKSPPEEKPATQGKTLVEQNQEKAFLAEREPRDESWAASIEAKVMGAKNSGGLPANGQINNITCKTTVCKMDVTFLEEGASHQFIYELERKVLRSELSGFSRTMEPSGPDGETRMQLILFRKGYSAPGLAEHPVLPS